MCRISYFWLAFLIAGVVLGILGFGALVPAWIVPLKVLSVMFFIAFTAIIITDVAMHHSGRTGLPRGR